MQKKLIHIFILGVVLSFLSPFEAQARRSKRKNYVLPTHPVVLWARTLEESTDPEQRKVAAFKLSQYTQPIFRISTIQVLLNCMFDKDLHIAVLCTKALSGAKNHSFDEKIRSALLSQLSDNPKLQNTVIRTLIERKDDNDKVTKTLYGLLQKTKNTEDLVVLLKYFELFGDGSDSFVEDLAKIYKNNDSARVRAAVMSSLGERGKGQDIIITLLADCATASDTPLQLTCLSGLESQAKKDSRAWVALEKSIMSSDPDVLIATLDVVNALPEKANPAISSRLVAILKDSDDGELKEKAALALGVAGDHSDRVVDVLRQTLGNSNASEGVRIAAALVLGQQAVQSSEAAKNDLSNCQKTATAQSLRTACQLGIQELEKRKKTSTSPVRANASEAK